MRRQEGGDGGGAAPLEGPPQGVPAARLVHTVSSIDVDSVQIHFASYFRWMDMGQGALMKVLGHPLLDVFASGYAAPTADVRCSYLRPVMHGDELSVASWVAETGRTSFVIRHRFECEGEVVAEGRITHVWIATGPPQRSTPLPDWLRAASADG